LTEERLVEELMQAPSERGKVLRGKNGRLFLDNDSNQIIKQYTGELLFSEDQLRDWRLVLENRIAWHERLGIPYHFLVPPNAHSVYPEDLPDTVRSAPVRPVQQLIQHLEEKQSFARIIYPLEELEAAKPDLELYQKTDSHWTAWGAFVVYTRLAAEIGATVSVHAVSTDDLKVREKPRLGDLGAKLDPQEQSLQVWATVRTPASRLVSDNMIWGRGTVVVTECEEAAPTSCLVFGDSFGMGLHPFLTSSFRRLVFAFIPTVDHELVRRERPDVVVSVLTERFLMQVPYDVGAPTVDDLAREKQAQGRVRTKDVVTSGLGAV
jgi:alginate O-acetyltransferase complex protein AlgJ